MQWGTKKWCNGAESLKHERTCILALDCIGLCVH